LWRENQGGPSPRAAQLGAVGRPGPSRFIRTIVQAPAPERGGLGIIGIVFLNDCRNPVLGFNHRFPNHERHRCVSAVLVAPCSGRCCRISIRLVPFELPALALLCSGYSYGLSCSRLSHPRSLQMAPTESSPPSSRGLCVARYRGNHTIHDGRARWLKHECKTDMWPLAT